MAGHSKFANIKHRKGAQDKKRAKLFTRLLREVSVAAKLGGPDADSNPRLRAALIDARVNNLPKDRLEAAIKKASSGTESDNYVEMRYEGYGPCSVAIIVEATTDNKNRTAGEVRSVFTKAGGNLGETGSVGFMFDHVGVIKFNQKDVKEEEIFDFAIEAGALDIEKITESEEDEEIERFAIITEVADFIKIRDELMEKFGDPVASSLQFKAKDPQKIEDEEKAEKIVRFLDALEDLDDVANVYGNFEF